VEDALAKVYPTVPRSWLRELLALELQIGTIHIFATQAKRHPAKRQAILEAAQRTEALMAAKRQVVDVKIDHAEARLKREEEG
jgi:transposase